MSNAQKIVASCFFLISCAQAMDEAALQVATVEAENAEETFLEQLEELVRARYIAHHVALLAYEAAADALQDTESIEENHFLQDDFMRDLSSVMTDNKRYWLFMVDLLERKAAAAIKAAITHTDVCYHLDETDIALGYRSEYLRDKFMKHVDRALRASFIAQVVAPQALSEDQSEEVTNYATFWKQLFDASLCRAVVTYLKFAESEGPSAYKKAVIEKLKEREKAMLKLLATGQQSASAAEFCARSAEFIRLGASMNKEVLWRIRPNKMQLIEQYLAYAKRWDEAAAHNKKAAVEAFKAAAYKK